MPIKQERLIALLEDSERLLATLRDAKKKVLGIITTDSVEPAIKLHMIKTLFEEARLQETTNMIRERLHFNRFSKQNLSQRKYQRRKRGLPETLDNEQTAFEILPEIPEVSSLHYDYDPDRDLKGLDDDPDSFS